MATSNGPWRMTWTKTWESSNGNFKLQIDFESPNGKYWTGPKVYLYQKVGHKKFEPVDFLPETETFSHTPGTFEDLANFILVVLTDLNKDRPDMEVKSGNTEDEGND